MPTNEAVDRTELEQMLTDAVAEVLETMFFTSLAEDGEPPAPVTGPCVCTKLSFRGIPSGRLGVRVPLETARKMAATFLGVEEEAVTETQLGEVACELSNMVCGSVLSRVESEAPFELLHPEIGPRETGCPRKGQVAGRTIALEEGVLEVWLELEQSR